MSEHPCVSSRVLAVTGSIASGKSRVTSFLNDLGAHSISLDDISRDLSEPGGLIEKAVADHMGREFLNPLGGLNRVRLAEFVFSSTRNRKRLNSITHPLIMAECHRQLETTGAQSGKPLVVEVPLLFECGLHYLFGGSMLVCCSQEVQLQRLTQRGLSLRDAQLRIDSQLSARVKRYLADFVIENSADWTLTEHQIRSVWEPWITTQHY
ncbi:MAG: dephospho-CoA kinase [Armatimonadota bacterium]